MSQDILIRGGKLSIIERSEGDVTALPDYDGDGDGASLICEADWIALVDEYGAEETVMEILGVTEDTRHEGEWRYVPVVEDGGVEI